MLDWHNLLNQIDTPPAAFLAELQNHRILQIEKVFFAVITALDSVSKISECLKCFFKLFGLVVQSTIFAGF